MTAEKEHEEGSVMSGMRHWEEYVSPCASVVFADKSVSVMMQTNPDGDKKGSGGGTGTGLTPSGPGGGPVGPGGGIRGLEEDPFAS